MSDCDTDSPDIHNKETRRRERKRDLRGGKGEEKHQEELFFLAHKICSCKTTNVLDIYHIQGKLRKERGDF